MIEKLNAGQRLKQKLRNGETTFGLWITLESPTISEIAAHIGLDWIVIDSENTGLDLQEVANHLRAISRSSTAGLVTIHEIDQGLIRRVLGLGAHGILVPRIRTAEEVERAVYFAKYPPRGWRGMGVENATSWGMGLTRAKNANQGTIVIPTIETVEAGRNIEAIMQVPDVDGFFFGPADFSASAGFVGEWEGPGVAEELLRIKERVRARGFACGIVATDPNNGKVRIKQDFQMIGLGVDCTLLAKTIAEMMNTLGRPLKTGVWTMET
jgi:2-dehydro-3-deoxyglucarate aldolase/4-hydroxy-2-oxoheptanedioate aldolase